MAKDFKFLCLAVFDMGMNCVKILEDSVTPSHSFSEAANICMSWSATFQ